MQPRNAVEAATHSDPYPYYRALQAGPALYFDTGLKAWVASRAEVIEEVLANPQCRVRPAAEAVPRAIDGSSAGEIFGKLIRMNEGEAHANGKRIIGRALAGMAPATVKAATRQAAEELARLHDLADGASLTRWIFELPTRVVAGLLGVPRADLASVTGATAAFVKCLSPLATDEELNHASQAALALRQCMAGLHAAGSLLPQAGDEEWADQDAMVANVVGLLSQTHEATAGLIGNCIVRMLTQAQSGGAEADLDAFVHEVMRRDPPVQNTRRFLAGAASIAGHELPAGAVIVLVLAAGGTGFGHGHHACPGKNIAMTIAATALSYLLETHRIPDPQATGWRYRPSLNARLPQFFTLKEHA